MNVKIENLPAKLKRDAFFCLWKYEKDQKGRNTKVPYNPNNPKFKTRSADRSTFARLDKAVQRLKRETSFGLGIGVFDRICAIDIDHCRDPETGRLSPMAQWIVDKMNCYAEISPSGEGIRLLFLVDECFVYSNAEYYIQKRHIGLEIYIAGSTEHFVTVTGNVLRGGDLEDRTWELMEVADAYMRKPERKAAAGKSARMFISLKDEEIIEKALKAANGIKFGNLWAGNWEVHDYPSQSEADLALCDLLAFYTVDPDQIDRLFRQSGLMRDKWERRADYSADTIAEALEFCSAHYNPFYNTVTLEPADYTDLGQAAVLVGEYGSRIRYSAATRFLVYNGQKWEEDELKAQKLSQEVTERQLKEAGKLLQEKRAALDALIQAEQQDQDAIGQAKAEVKRVEKYRKYVLARRASNKVKAALTETAPRVQIDVAELDTDPFLLNTPAGTVDLRTGQIRAHDAGDYCTKITAASPDDTGREIWEKFLDDITVQDNDLKRYLQDVAGLCVIGCVKREEMIIAYGDGSNGKSTLFNLWARILGDYAGMLSADTLTVSSRKNKSPEIAELRGKRFVIAAELEEAQRLDTAMVKKLCSTDEIFAEKKFKDPFKFLPSHHLILFTNYLPKVGTSDTGTWRRLVVVPFNASFTEGTNQIKDYAGHLFERCAGAALAWIIEGARRVIAQDYAIVKPECVMNTIEAYKEDNDWLTQFITERCIVRQGLSVTGGDLYQAYREYCKNTGEFARRNSDFAKAISDAGYMSRKTKHGKVYFGIAVMTEYDLYSASITDKREAEAARMIYG